ncbi:MAG: ribosome biosis GTPase / thiamine phosphate phosphatase [Acidobacteriota bacterium]|nr:ribosome biosis GTPase / thiamine phosphate phosphatase [Acidobacteriota bacterium]
MEERFNLETYGWDESFAAAFAPFAAEGFEAGRVFLQHNRALMLYTATGETAAETTGRLRYHARGGEDLPAVGDWVAFRRVPEESKAKIHEIVPRRSKFSRRAAGSETLEQIVAANVDTVFLVTGLDDDYNPRRVERYLIMAWESGAEPVVVLNKADLIEEVEERRLEIERVAPGVPVLALSAKRGVGVEQLLPYVGRGRTVALMGSSGTGKSTITNRLLGAEVQRTQEVRLADARGRHTTTHRELFVLPEGGLVLDTPGMRELQLLVSEKGLRETFEEIEEVAAHCRFTNCGHEGEPGCAVRAALDAGELDAERYRNYRKMGAEMRHAATLVDQRKAQEEKSRVKRIHRDQKKIYKRKGKETE